MTFRSAIMNIVQQEDVNFLLTNGIPRRLATRFIGWFSRIEQPLVRDVSLATWRFFSALDLSEAKQTRFRSMRDCFTRELRDGARPIDPDPDILVSPCDAIVGAMGTVNDGRVLQVKGHEYPVEELLGSAAQAATFRDGTYVTLRLTSSMYHRFHAPCDCTVEEVTHFPGDVWNVNPATLRRVRRLFCRNERAVINARMSDGHLPITLVAVGAVLVASIQLPFLGARLRSSGNRPQTFPCQAWFRRGQEIGWFEQGSTIVLLAPRGPQFCDHIREGTTIRVGQKLLRMPPDARRPPSPA